MRRQTRALSRHACPLILLSRQAQQVKAGGEQVGTAPLPKRSRLYGLRPCLRAWITQQGWVIQAILQVSPAVALLTWDLHLCMSGLARTLLCTCVPRWPWHACARWLPQHLRPVCNSSSLDAGRGAELASAGNGHGPQMPRTSSHDRPAGSLGPAHGPDAHLVRLLCCRCSIHQVAPVAPAFSHA